MSLMNALRRVADLPGIRAVVLRPGVRRRIARVLAARFLVGAWCTTTPWTVLRREFLDAGTTHLYVLRRTGLPIALQHGRDMEALFEVFVRGEYEPPSELRARLTNPSVVLDIGANIGAFSAWARGRWPQADIVAVEPVAENARVYRAWATTAQDTLRLIEAAAGTEPGHAVFVQGMGGGDRRASPDDMQGDQQTVGTGFVTVPVVDILPVMADADVIKMDIEGGEWPILADPRLADLRSVTLVMEYHRHGAPFLPAADAARQLLTRAGFRTGFARPNHWGHGILWAWKD
ncbi:FkbM family methyltransferase [Kocuria sp.]|uniref:FkbM family methyltransferase n=1 Tax=Kocuria sp. TaxID=1871328 RepID=UPI0026DAB8A6|nr:FkbM family methyltransferase [Kocuria sp.]MDO4918769.1 FkbM family methyltransferase [Kocuria sp.]